VGESRIFGQLSSELPLKERKILLDKLTATSTLTRTALYEDDDNPSPVSEQNEYNRLPWYVRLFFLFLGLFHGTSPLRVFKDHQINQLGLWIKVKAPGMYDYRRDLLLPGMYKKLIALKEAARFFYTVLERGITRDKGAFYAFLGSLEMEDIHYRINDGIDPERIIAKNPETPEAGLRQIVQNNLAASLASITEDQKNVMYANTRSLQCLKALSGFLFDRLVLNFSTRPVDQGPVCTAGIVKDQLTVLQNLLFSLKYAPSMALLESLFFFTLQDRPADGKADVNEEMGQLLIQAEKSLNAIHDFNRAVPLTQILRCTTRNLTLASQDISGGEEWFFVYRDYWKQYADEQFTRCIQNRRQQDLTGALNLFFRGTGLKKLNHVLSDSDPSGFPVNGVFCLSFLSTFHSIFFMNEINQFLSSIFLSGIFSSQDDRAAFTENYNELMKLGDAIQYFEIRIAPTGDLGQRYAAALGDTTVSSLRRHKIQTIIDEASDGGFKIIHDSRSALEGMIDILRKIIQNMHDGKFGVLSNIAFFIRKGDFYITGLNDAMAQLQKTLKLLNDIWDFEIGK
jgi:hypothetical protein